MLVYDTKEDLWVRAEYINPIYDSYVEEPRRFFHKVRELMAEEE